MICSIPEWTSAYAEEGSRQLSQLIHGSNHLCCCELEYCSSLLQVSQRMAGLLTCVFVCRSPSQVARLARSAASEPSKRPAKWPSASCQASPEWQRIASPGTQQPARSSSSGARCSATLLLLLTPPLFPSPAFGQRGTPPAWPHILMRGLTPGRLQYPPQQLPPDSRSARPPLC